MLDVKWIRENQEAFIKGLTDRRFGEPESLLNQILTSDEQRRGTIQELQDLQAKRNAASKDIGKAKQALSNSTPNPTSDETLTDDPTGRGTSTTGDSEHTYIAMNTDSTAT